MKHTLVVIVSGLVALAVSVLAPFLVPQASPPSAGFTQSNVGEFPEGAKIGDVGVRNVAVSIPAGQSQFAYCNRSGRVQYVPTAVLRTTGTASTTQTLTAGTSTATTFNSFSVPVNVKSLINLTIATSGIATTTNSMQGAGATVGNGAGVATLADGVCLNVGIYQTYAQSCVGNGLCEPATSTARGFNVLGYIEVVQP